jgi:hypothetical protein
MEDADSDTGGKLCHFYQRPSSPHITVKSCYKTKAESKKLLMGMCYGLSNGDDKERKIGDLSLEPYASARNKKLFTPPVKQLHIKMVRQAVALWVKAPRSSHYTKDRCYKWLMQHPIAHPVDITFLVEEQAKFKAEVEAAANKVKAKFRQPYTTTTTTSSAVVKVLFFISLLRTAKWRTFKPSWHPASGMLTVLGIDY